MGLIQKIKEMLKLAPDKKQEPDVKPQTGALGKIHDRIDKIGLKKKNQKGPIKNTSIPIQIVKKRGDSIVVEMTTGKVGYFSKESELPRLKLKNGKEIDSFDFTKINSEGVVVLVETPDGQMVYADIDAQKISQIGEGVLRDGFVLNQDWVNATFPKSESRWRMLMPILVGLIAVIGIGIVSWVTYGYLKDSLGEYITQLEDFKQIVRDSAGISEKVSRSLELSSQSNERIAQSVEDSVKMANSISNNLLLVSERCSCGNVSK